MSRFDEMYGNDGELYYPRPTKMLIDYLSRNSITGRALDLGCGDGRNSLWLLRNSFHVTALDISRPGVEKLIRAATQAELASHLDARVESVSETSAFDRKYDLIIASTLLCHLPRIQADRLFQRMCTALAPDALLYISVFTVDDPSYGNSSAMSETGDAVINHYSMNELLRLLLRFTVVCYSEGRELDTSHGSPHYHSIARAMARMDVIKS